MSGKLTRPLLDKMDPSVLGTAAKALRARASKIEHEPSQFPHRLRYPAGGDEWTGPASDTLQERADGFGRTYNEEHTRLLDGSGVYEQADGFVSESRSKARGLVTATEAKSVNIASPDGRMWDCGEPFQVADDFTVNVKPGAVPSNAPWQIGQLVQWMALAYTDDIKKLVTQLEELGQYWGKRTREALDFTHLALDSKGQPYTPWDPRKPVHDYADGIADGTVPIPNDPNILHDLWGKLTPDEKDKIYKRYPDIGNHGGIPFKESDDPSKDRGRDHYNRRHLNDPDGLIDQKQAEIDKTRAEHPDWPVDRWDKNPGSPDGRKWREWSQRLGALQHDMDGYHNVQAALDKSRSKADGGDGLPRYLGLLDDKGHAAVSIGNPDLAKKSSTFVPGTGQDMSKMTGSDEYSRRLYQMTHQMDPSLGPNGVSVTTWMGYDRPMQIFNPADDKWAGDPAYAKDGAQALDDYQAGIRASHDDAAAGGRAYQTVIGHSYGSVEVGAAASNGHHLDADAIGGVGTPGMIGNSAHDMNINPDGRVFIATAENDIIRISTELAAPVAELGVGPLGNNPTTWDDATQFKTDPGPKGPWYTEGYSGDAHSSYFEKDSTGLQNMGRIIDGQEPEHK